MAGIELCLLFSCEDLSLHSYLHNLSLSHSCREGNEPGDSMKITYSELLSKVCQFANVLQEQGI